MARNHHFQFKQFRILQERSAMKVGMDGVLIGAWTDVTGGQHILDVGSGTGLIALMMAQRNPSAMIDAIEIDQEAFEECQFNIEQSPWSRRVKVEHCSFEKFLENGSAIKYDLIVSNPPYFVKGIKAPHLSRSTARHSDSLPLDILIASAASLMEKRAKMALVLPVESLSQVKALTVQNNLFLSRLCMVKPNPQKPVFRIMVEISNFECHFQQEELMIEFEEHFDYTPEYRRLTKDFYLKFD